MEITIDGTTYGVQLTGTVGLMALAERRLGEPFDASKSYHLFMLYYIAMERSNKGKKLPDIDEFIASFTTAKLKAFTHEFWTAWERIDPTPKAAEGEAPKNV